MCLKTNTRQTRICEKTKIQKHLLSVKEYQIYPPWGKKRRPPTIAPSGQNMQVLGSDLALEGHEWAKKDISTSEER